MMTVVVIPAWSLTGCLVGCAPRVVTPQSSPIPSGQGVTVECRHAGNLGYLDFDDAFWNPTTPTSCVQGSEIHVQVIDNDDAIVTTEQAQSFTVVRVRGPVAGLCID
jgi:hypothetical protein